MLKLVVFFQLFLLVVGHPFLEKLLNLRWFGKSSTQLEESLSVASRKGHFNTVSQLLQKGVNPAANQNSALREASRYGQTDIVKMLLAHEKVDPSANQNAALRYAASAGYDEIVGFLLQHPKVDPSAHRNEAIRNAASQGHTDIVKLLLSDTRVDPSAQRNEALLLAAGNGHAETVKLLLAHPKVDLAARHNEAIQDAAFWGRSNVIELLLRDKRVDPSAEDNQAIRMTARFGHTEATRLLLRHPKVDPTANDNEAIRDAVVLGKTDMVKLLLADGRADPSAKDDLAIRYEAEFGKTESIMKLLLTDGRSNPSVNNNKIIKHYIHGSNMKKLLLQDPRVRAIQHLDSLLDKTSPSQKASHLTSTAFLKMIDFSSAWKSKSYMNEVLSHPKVQEFFASMFGLSREVVGEIKSLGAVDNAVNALQIKLNGDNSAIARKKRDFIFRYYASTWDSSGASKTRWQHAISMAASKGGLLNP